MKLIALYEAKRQMSPQEFHELMVKMLHAQEKLRTPVIDREASKLVKKPHKIKKVESQYLLPYLHYDESGYHLVDRPSAAHVKSASTMILNDRAISFRFHLDVHVEFQSKKISGLIPARLATAVRSKIWHGHSRVSVTSTHVAGDHFSLYKLHSAPKELLGHDSNVYTGPISTVWVQIFDYVDAKLLHAVYRGKITPEDVFSEEAVAP